MDILDVVFMEINTLFYGDDLYNTHGLQDTFTDGPVK